jgi:radical SAM superfamily enzyme YgiQ (UPF0313 family)
MKTLFITKPFFIAPLGLMYLSAAAKKEGHEVELALTTEDLTQRIQKFQPDFVAYSVMTGDQDFYLDLNRQLKLKSNFKSLFGGPHTTFFPDLIKEDGVDIVCRGEAEEAFVELLNHPDSLEAVANLSIKTHDGVKHNPLRELSQIDSLAFPDRSLIEGVPQVFNGPIKHFIASRGCPFDCTYCFNQSFFDLYRGKGSRIRIRESSSVVQEVSEAVLPSTRFVYFQDDTFTLSKSWLRAFSAHYSSAIKLPFHCHVRPNTIDEEKINLLKNAGCYSVHIAAETANDHLRNNVLNRNMSREQITNAAKLLRKYDIKFMMQNIIGLPTGTIEDDLATLELNIECKPDYAWVSIFQPYPGTKLGEFCRQQGLYTGDFRDLGSNFFDKSPMNVSEEYKTQLSNLQKYFALFVEHPELHRSGLSRVMINSRRTPELTEAQQKFYKDFRNRCDERLFGFRL